MIASHPHPFLRMPKAVERRSFGAELRLRDDEVAILCDDRIGVGDAQAPIRIAIVQVGATPAK